MKRYVVFLRVTVNLAPSTSLYHRTETLNNHDQLCLRSSIGSCQPGIFIVENFC